MNEITLQWVQIIKLLLLVGFASLYGFGGVRGKWKRRIIGSLLLTASFVGVSLWVGTFSYWLLLCAPLLFGSLSIGYGGDNLKDKIIKRSRAGLAHATAILPLAIVNQAWMVLGLHILLMVLVSTILGVWNPTKSARAEETIIGFTIGFLPLMGMI